MMFFGGLLNSNIYVLNSKHCCLRHYEEDMYWRRVEEEQHHWEDRRRMPDGGYPQGPPGPPGLLGMRPGMPILQPQGPMVGSDDFSEDIVVTRCQIFSCGG